MPKTIVGALATELGNEATTLCTLWTLTRVDGTVYRFTDHDVDVVFEGNTYLASVGYNRTAVANQVGLSVDNLDVMGFIDNSAITDIDLRAGRFDYAEIRVVLVNWSDLSQGELKMRRGRLGEVILTDSGLFQTELRGLTQAYSQKIVETYQPDCRTDLGSTKCKVPLLPAYVQRGTAYALGDVVRASPALDGIFFPQFLAPYDTDADDISANVAGATVGYQAAVQSVQSMFGGGSIEFSPSFYGSSLSRVTYPNLTAYRLGASPFTISGWVRFKDLTQTIQTLIALQGPSTSRSWAVKRNGGNLEFVYSTTGSTTTSITGAFAWVIDTWYHFEVTRDAAGDVRLFVDGTQVGATTAATGTFYATSALLSLGSTTDTTTGFQNLYGFIDDARILNGAAEHTSGFSVPVAAYTSPDFDALTGVLLTEDYDDRIYTCTTAGTTALAEQPHYDTTVANTTTDGDAVFTASEAWTRAGVVATLVDNNRLFTATIDETRAVDDWFKYGAVIWDTGDNHDLAMEVKTSVHDATTGAATIDVTDFNTFTRSAGSFVTDGFVAGMVIVTTGFTNAGNNGTFTVQTVGILTLDIVETTLISESGTGDETIISPDYIELFLEMPYAIQVGDKFAIYAGCDKRIATCFAKFNNVVNFRGEAFVPGQDAYVDYPTNPA
jgi:hypothetical protein